MAAELVPEHSDVATQNILEHSMVYILALSPVYVRRRFWCQPTTGLIKRNVFQP